MSDQKMDYKEQLKVLRQKRGKVPSELNDYRKETNRIHKLILEAVASDPKTVPQIADQTGLSPQTVFWHVNALRKYNQLIDDKKNGDYMQYKSKNGGK